MDAMIVSLLELPAPPPYNPLVGYAGTRPPQKSYKNPILKCELYAFSWESRHFGCRVYLKFALKGEAFWLISLS